MHAMKLCALSLLFGCNVVLGFAHPGAAESDVRVSIAPPTLSSTDLTVPLLITVANDGPDSAQAIYVTVDLPEGAKIIADPPCQGGDHFASCGLSLNANTSTVLPLSWIPAGGTITASVAGGDIDSDFSNNTAKLEVPGNADLELVPVVGSVGDTLQPGEFETYAFQLHNNGIMVATSINVAVAASPGFSALALNGEGWICTDRICSLQSLLPRTTAREIAWTGRAPSTAGAVRVIATASSATFDPIADNNRATYTQTVVTDTDLQLAVDATPDPVMPGGMLTYTLYVTNAGPSLTADVSVTDTLPSGAVFVSASGTGWTCSAAGQVVTCTCATLAVTNAPPLTVAATAPTSTGAITNTAVVSSASAETYPTDNTASVTTTVGP